MIQMDSMYDYWAALVAAFSITLSLLASIHALMTKRDPTSTVAWVGLIWLSPFLGFILYVTFGINRVHRKAALERGKALFSTRRQWLSEKQIVGASPKNLFTSFADFPAVGNQFSPFPLCEGNSLRALKNGDEAYEEMLQAIRCAKLSVSLQTYIFDRDEIGKKFVHELEAAKKRGVDVRVLIDDVGARYSFPSVIGLIRKKGISFSRFHPTLLPFGISYLNLRNHRKILVCDGRVGFTGGMNIRDGHRIAMNPSSPIQDLHFQVCGPVVEHLQRTFCDDWFFSSGEKLSGEKWFPQLEKSGETYARGIPDGPDEFVDSLKWVLCGALRRASKRVRILTPYFVPDSVITASIKAAAQSGVEVEILLPERNNLKLVQWASLSILDGFLDHGCRVFLTPPPFDHAKLFTVDGEWGLLGSANWDSRSLKLNFEFDLEFYDHQWVSDLDQLIDERKTHSREVSRDEILERSFPLKVLHNSARLFSHYL